MFLWVLVIIIIVIYVALANAKRMNTLKNVILFQLVMFEIIYIYIYIVDE